MTTSIPQTLSLGNFLAFLLFDGSAFVHVTNQQFILYISSSVKITDPDKPSSSTSPLPLNNPSAAMKEHLPLISSTSDDLNAHLPLMSSPSRFGFSQFYLVGDFCRIFWFSNLYFSFLYVVVHQI